MNNLLKTLAIALLLIAMSSCTEDDKGTSPENNNVGATFQFDGEQTWDYEYYYAI